MIWSLALTCTGLLVLTCAWTLKSLAGDHKNLAEAANLGQIIGVPLAALGVVLSVASLIVAIIASRGAVPLTPRERLAEGVYEIERKARKALLRGIVPADVTFAPEPAPEAGSAEPTASLATAPPEPGLPQQVWRAAQQMLHWQPLPVGSSAASSPSSTDGPRPKEQSCMLSQITGYFTDLSHARLVIVGRKGSGKTVLAIELVIGLAKAIKYSGASGPVPVRLSAASWTAARPFPIWLAEQLTATYGIPPRDAHALVSNHQVLPVLDGLDEMDPGPPSTLDDEDADNHDGDAIAVSGMAAAEAPRPQRAAALIEALNDYGIDTFAPVVITTRPDIYARLRQNDLLLDHAERVVIQRLSLEQITVYLTDRHRDRPGQYQAWQPILEQLDVPAWQGVQRFLSTPWRLMLATTAIDADPAQAALLTPVACGRSETIQQTCERLEHVLLAGFISAACRPTLGTRGPYTARQVERWLTALAGQLRWQSEYAQRKPVAGMSAVDIVPHLLWPIGGRVLPWLLHAVAAVGSLIVGFVLPTPLSQLFRWEVFIQVWQVSLWPVTMTAIGFGIVAVALSRKGWAWWPRPLVRSGRLELIELASGFIAGLSAGFIFGVLHGFAAGLAVGFVFGLAAWFVFGLGASWQPAIELSDPHRAVRHDLAFGLLFGLGVGFMYGLEAGFGGGLAIGLGAGLTVGAAGARYLFGVSCAALRRRLPWRLATFCRWACAAGLLRVAGVSYQFRHRKLQEWLLRDQESSASP